MGDPLDEFVLSDIPDYRNCAILALSSLRGNKGARQQLPWQSSPRAPAPAPAIRASLDLAQDIVTDSRIVPNARKTATSSGECGVIQMRKRCPRGTESLQTPRWSKPDSNLRSHSLRQPRKTSMRRLLAAALVTKGRCSRSLAWSGTRGSTTVSAVVHVAGRSAGHAWAILRLRHLFGKWGGQRCRRIRLFLLQPTPGW